MKISNIVIATSFVWLLVSFWNRNDLPQNIDYVPEILNEPLQTATRKPSFNASYNGVEYLIEPEYEYDQVFDPSGNTALVGASLMFDILCLIADSLSARKK